jgi:hypothetical protein
VIRLAHGSAARHLLLKAERWQRAKSRIGVSPGSDSRSRWPYFIPFILQLECFHITAPGVSWSPKLVRRAGVSWSPKLVRRGSYYSWNVSILLRQVFRGAPSWYDELEVYCPRKVYSCAWLKEFVDPLPFKPRHASVPAGTVDSTAAARW